MKGTFKRDIPIPHPGHVLRDEFMEPLKISVYALAKSIGVPRSRMNEICRGHQRISASIALRLGQFFSVDAQWFLNMQSRYDLEVAQEELAAELSHINPFCPA
jgi:antitoxin HigA-1